MATAKIFTAFSGKCVRRYIYVETLPFPPLNKRVRDLVVEEEAPADTGGHNRAGVRLQRRVKGL